MKAELPRLTTHRSGERTLTLTESQWTEAMEHKRLQGENRALWRVVRLLLGKDVAPGGDP